MLLKWAYITLITIGFIILAFYIGWQRGYDIGYEDSEDDMRHRMLIAEENMVLDMCDEFIKGGGFNG